MARSCSYNYSKEQFELYSLYRYYVYQGSYISKYRYNLKHVNLSVSITKYCFTIVPIKQNNLINTMSLI